MIRLDGITDSMDMSLSKLEDNEGQRILVCYSQWGHKESDTTYRLNNCSHIFTDIFHQLSLENKAHYP